MMGNREMIMPAIGLHSAEALQIRARLIERCLPGLPPEGTESWEDAATAVAGLFEALARVTDSPTFLSDALASFEAFGDGVMPPGRPRSRSQGAGPVECFERGAGSRTLTLSLADRRPLRAGQCRAMAEAKPDQGLTISLAPHWLEEALVTSPLDDLPFRDQLFDRVHIPRGLASLLYPDRALRECLRVLRPGGGLLVEAPFMAPGASDSDDALRFTAGYFTRVLPDLGFIDVLVEPSQGGMEPLLELLRQLGPMRRLSAEKRLQANLVRAALERLLEGILPFTAFFSGKAKAYAAVTAFAAKPGLPAEPGTGSPEDAGEAFLPWVLTLMRGDGSALPVIEGDRIRMAGSPAGQQGEHMQ